MTAEYEEISSENPQAAVSVGNNRHVSMQVLQDVYNEITGKKETISKAITSSHITKFEDIRQLNTKITQLYEQYNIVDSNCSVTLYHTDDCKEQFSSFERFEMFDSTALSPTENIRLVYDFLIILPKLKKPQPYTITVNLHSRAAMRQRAEKEHGLPKKMIRLFSRQTGNVELSYIDYTVARSFMTAIDHWEKGLPKNTASKTLEISQSFGEHFPFIFRLLTTGTLASTFFFYKENYITNTPDLTSVFSAGILIFSVIFISAQLSYKLGQLAEAYIDEYQAASSLKLNRGDETAYENQRKGNTAATLKYAGSIFVTFAINLACVWISTKIGLAT